MQSRMLTPISSLIAQSNQPPIKLLSVAFRLTANTVTFYYGPGGIVITCQWTNSQYWWSINSLVYQRDDRLVVEGADIWSGMTL